MCRGAPAVDNPSVLAGQVIAHSGWSARRAGCSDGTLRFGWRRPSPADRQVALMGSRGNGAFICWRPRASAPVVGRRAGSDLGKRRSSQGVIISQAASRVCGALCLGTCRRRRRRDHAQPFHTRCKAWLPTRWAGCGGLRNPRPAWIEWQLWHFDPAQGRIALRLRASGGFCNGQRSGRGPAVAQPAFAITPQTGPGDRRSPARRCWSIRRTRTRKRCIWGCSACRSRWMNRGRNGCGHAQLLLTPESYCLRPAAGEPGRDQTRLFRLTLSTLA